MTSRGTPRHTFRLDVACYVEVLSAIRRRNFWSRRAPWTESDFIREAIIEKLAHMNRSRRPRRRGRPNELDGAAGQLAATPAPFNRGK
jgi:hypothetical protein